MKPKLVYVKDLNGAFLIVSKTVADQFDYDKERKEVTPDMLEQMRSRELELRKKKVALVRISTTKQ